MKIPETDSFLFYGIRNKSGEPVCLRELASDWLNFQRKSKHYPGMANRNILLTA